MKIKRTSRGGKDSVESSGAHRRGTVSKRPKGEVLSRIIHETSAVAADPRCNANK